MTGTITLTLTRDEALALYELSDMGMQRFVCDPRGGSGQRNWTMDVAGAACDKLAKAALGNQSPPTWRVALAQIAE